MDGPLNELGLVNTLLGYVGIPPQPFLSSPNQALACIIFMAIYQYVGYYIIIFLAGLQGIPQDYYDAAAVDGASGPPASSGTSPCRSCGR